MHSDDINGPHEDQINVKLSASLKKRLGKIYEDKGIAPAEILRRIAICAVEYYEETGKFSFPLILASHEDLLGEIDPVFTRLENIRGVLQKASNDAKSQAAQNASLKARHQRWRKEVKKIEMGEPKVIFAGRDISELQPTESKRPKVPKKTKRA